MKPKTCAEIKDEQDRIVAILNNYEPCHKHSWRNGYREYYSFIKHRSILEPDKVCRYCGILKSFVDAMVRELRANYNEPEG